MKKINIVHLANGTVSFLKEKFKKVENSDLHNYDNYVNIKSELQKANKELELIRNKLNYVVGKQDIDIVIEEINIAEKKLDLLVKKAKILQGVPLANSLITSEKFVQAEG